MSNLITIDFLSKYSGHKKKSIRDVFLSSENLLVRMSESVPSESKLKRKSGGKQVDWSVVELNYKQVMALLMLMGNSSKSTGLFLTLLEAGELSKNCFVDDSDDDIPHSVYVVEFSDGVIKIGVSSQMDIRLNSLGRQRGFKVERCSTELYHTKTDALSVESKLHKRFSKNRGEGEYFIGIEYSTILTLLGELK